MTSIVIAAHNEAAVIGACLDAILAGAAPGEFDITVVANGCRDATAALARERSGVRVIDRPEPGKTGALNAGDAAAVGFPRLYLDADIVVSAADVRALAAVLDRSDRGGPVAAMPARRFDFTGSPLLVRGYFAINRRLPVFRDGLFGRGLIVLSQAGRSRFDTFPDVIADDLFLDSLFASAEKHQADAVVTTIAAPRRTGDLVRRLIRVRSGNAALRGAAIAATTALSADSAVRSITSVRRSHPWSWLRDVVLPRPWLTPAAVCYVAITVVAALGARRAGRSGGGGPSWGQDTSTRASVSSTSEVSSTSQRK